jgi:ATP-dependent Lon protease
MNDVSILKSNICQIETTMEKIRVALDNSIYSHAHAKNQIMKIIGQWMNGEQTGYCFGFEGCPGIGKTSLAKKGLANCLLDENSTPRPFSFIAIGGSTSGSTIEGHGYTYVNSTWGKIVDILMETKCMNPIIYIDELDKVSKTESGREIISIFTHLIDSTQNDSFQDKYFSGIDIDLSKALFIFSYNDPEQIDKVLLDRIHRIKFDNLSIEDKLVIVRKFILPELNEKMGFENVLLFSDEIIKAIIEEYTLEPGVRKLKEILFDIFGEVNLELIKTSTQNEIELPISITSYNLENKYLTKYKKINKKYVHPNNEIGIINGLWANASGFGGIIPIQTMFYPSSTFLELKLTGLQGDVMKESMNVAKSLAWNLTNDKIKMEWIKKFEETKCQGLHIHCPEGGISKDGPSAGVAITCALYSLFNNLKIKNTIAITGEICLNGDVSAIGGLDAKIQGGVAAGVNTIMYPKKNHQEFLEFEKKQTHIDNSIRFVEISHIKEVFETIFDVSSK